MNHSRSILAGLLAALSFALPAAHAADAYPTRAVTLVNPYAAGGPADTLARTLATKLEAKLGQPVVVENRAGAGATVGTGYVARAQPDGYTLLMGTSPGIVVAPLMTKTSYKGLEDFRFIAMVANQPVMLVAGPKAGFQTMADMLDYARKNPGKLNFASAGTGGPTHLSGELLRQRAEIDITHVPYRGAAPAMQDVIGGQVELAMVSVSAALPFIQDGRLKALAYTGAERSPLLPDVPTVAEAGVKNWTPVTTWYVLAAPKGTPQNVVDTLSKAVLAINAEPEHKKFLADNDATAQALSPAELTEFAQKDEKNMRELLGSLDLLAK